MKNVIPGWNPSEAAIQKHIKEQYVQHYDTRRNDFYFNKIVKHKGNFASFNYRYLHSVLKYLEYIKMALSVLISSSYMALSC